MTAATRVHDTYELLENILLHLPLQRLLLAVRVSKTALAVIKRSQAICQALFRESVLAHASSPTVSFSCDRLYRRQWWADTESGCEIPYVPIRNPLPRGYLHFPAERPCRLYDSGEGCLSHGKDSQATSKALLRGLGSWKSMLLSQPPASELVLTCDRLKEDGDPDPNEVAGDRKHGLYVKNVGGVTVGEYYKSVARRARACLKDNVCMKWRTGGNGDVAWVSTKTTGWEMLEALRMQAHESKKQMKELASGLHYYDSGEES